MIKIPIDRADIDFAKEETKKFDAQKIYDKTVRRPEVNYIGLLGEITFHKWLKKQGIKHKWIEFTKKAWEEPDFIIGGKAVDLKTSFDTKMWIQEPKFYYYIFARVNEDMKYLYVIGIISKRTIDTLMKKGGLIKFERPNRIDYHVYLAQMKSIESYFEKLLGHPLIYDIIE